MDSGELGRILSRTGGRLVEVGGCVRDLLLGKPAKDFDYLILGVPADRVIKALERHGHVDVVGASFGVIKFTPRGERTAMDISLPRKEVSTGTGHRDFDVTADPAIPLEVDLGRRDFTINAMARDPSSGEILDPFGGQKDLRDRVIRAVSPVAFKEDPLRILRGGQFMARLEFTIEPRTVQWMEAARDLIPTVSPERISMELVKGLKAGKPSRMFRFLRHHGFLVHILPELDRLFGIPQPLPFHDRDAGDHSVDACDATPVTGENQVYLRWAALCHDLGKCAPEHGGTLAFTPDGRPTFHAHAVAGERIARAAMDRLKLASTGELLPTERILTLIREHMFECPDSPEVAGTDQTWRRAVRRLSSRAGAEVMADLVALRVGDHKASARDDSELWAAFGIRVRDLLAEKPPLTVKDLKLNGKDLIAMGVAPGPAMGGILKDLLARVVDDPGLNERETLMELVRSHS